MENLKVVLVALIMIMGGALFGGYLSSHLTIVHTAEAKPIVVESEFGLECMWDSKWNTCFCYRQLSAPWGVLTWVPKEVCGK